MLTMLFRNTCVQSSEEERNFGFHGVKKVFLGGRGCVEADELDAFMGSDFLCFSFLLSLEEKGC